MSLRRLNVKINRLIFNQEAMKKFVSEERSVYEDYYHGQFSKKLAEWAISNMKISDAATKTMKPLKAVSLQDFREFAKANAIEIPDNAEYTAWYLYNMAIADYPKALETVEQRLHFVEETICDPDCDPSSVLECFTAKMCCMGVPIFWEKYL